ncbi:MAG: glutamate synthase subunit beta, partial [Zoogloea sp.]|nr:glutamate synthase subunit beta [Zoogloea sp.]
MGKPTGFMEYQRLTEAALPVEERTKNYKEFVIHLSDEEAAVQGARCMDCGIPFCNNGCPVNNIIPDWNDLVYRGKWREAIAVLHSTNNFPDFTGRICPAPCEAACTLNINSEAVGIKSIEHAIIDKAWAEDWIKPQVPAVKTGKKIAVVGSGPAGMAAAQQLARVGHDVTVFEKSSRIGGLLRYGIPDFKLEKGLIDRRVAQMEAEGVTFRTSVCVGATPGAGINNDAKTVVSADELKAEFDAVILAAGSENPRDLPVPGRELQGVHFALEFLIPQNKEVAGDAKNPISAAGKNVV